MAIGPILRVLGQLVIPVVAVMARAIPAAYGQALQNARKAGGAAAADAAQKAPIFGKKALSHGEALQILNLADSKTLTPEAVSKQFERYMAANDVKKGGSFYLQSKFYRANELLQEYIAEQQKATGATEVPVKPPDEDDNNNNNSRQDASQTQSDSDRQQKQ